MLEKRHRIGLFIIVFLFSLASTASAVPQFNFEINSPVNLTTLLTADATAIGLSFNLTNATGDAFEDGPVNNWNVTNVSIFAILSNATEVELGVTGPSFLDAVYDRGVTYIVTKTVVVNATAIPITETTITLNITADIFNGTENGALTNETNFNSSETFLGFSFILDGSAPDVTIKFLDVHDIEKTAFPATDLVRIVCTRSSTGASYNNTNISIQTPDSITFNELETDLTRDTTSQEFIVDFTDTRVLGDYNVACYSFDDLGSINDTVNTTFSVLKKPPSGSSPFVNPNFKPPVATILVGSGSVSDLGSLTEEGISRLIAREGGISFVLAETTYTFTLKEATETSATFTVAGVATPFDVTLNEQETKPLDVSGDGADDVSLTLHQVYNKKADTTFKLLTGSQQTPTTTTPAEQTSVSETTQESQTSSSSGWGYTILFLIIIVFVLGALHYFSARKRRGGRTLASGNSVQFTPRDMGMQQQSSNEPRTFTRN